MKKIEVIGAARKRKYIITGLSPLVNLCCSGIVTKNDLIVYVVVKNIDRHKKFPDTIYDGDKEWAKKIVNFFSYEMTLEGPVSWECPPSEHRKNIKVINGIKFEIKLGDIVSENLLSFIKGEKKRIPISTFPEGASCYSRLHKKKRGLIGSLFFAFIKYILVTTRQKFITHWILPDVEGAVARFIKKKDIRKIELIDEKEYFERRKRLSLFLANEYSGFDYRSMKDLVLHTPISALSDSETIEWLKLIRIRIGEKKTILIKPHPSDTRDYKKLFKKQKCIFVENKFTRLPAELLKDQMPDLRYAGFYSTLMLAFKNNEIFFVAPANKSIVDIYKKSYAGFKRLRELGFDADESNTLC